MRSERFGWLPLVMLVALVGVPLLEIVVLTRLAAAIGFWPTVLVLLGMAGFGLALIAREGRRTWRAMLETVGRGEVPAREMIDGVLVVVGGALLVFPGLVSDVLGLVCLLPFTRPLPRRLVQRWAAGRGTSLIRMDQRSTVIRGDVVTDQSPNGPSPDGSSRDDDPPPALEGRIIE